MADPPADSPPLDPRLEGINKLRDTARWLIAAFAAIAAVLVGTAPLLNLGKLDSGDWRLWVAGAAAAVGLAAIAAMIQVTANVLTPVSKGLKELVHKPAMRKIFSENFELLGGHGMSLEEFKAEYDRARFAYVEAVEHHRDNPGDPAATAEEERTQDAFYELAPVVARIMNEGLLTTFYEKFRVARRAVIGGSFVAGIAIVVFAWAANPASPTTTTTTAAKAAPVSLDVSKTGPGVTISGADAARLLRAHGLTAADAQSYVESFYGPIAAETVGQGRLFLRYAATAGRSGRFITTTRFHTPGIARLALHLPWTNTAACLQRVRVKRRTLVLVGAVAFGKPGVQQFVVLDPKAFSFSHGLPVARGACPA